MKSSCSVHPGTACTATLLAVLLGALYCGTFSWLVTVDWLREDYSSSALIPLIAAYLLYDRRAAVARSPWRPSWLGLLPVCCGIALYWLGELAGEFFSLYLSFWLVLVGLLWSWLGGARLKVLRFPLLFLLAMFPLPNYLNTMVTLKLKLISSWLGVWVMRLCGLSAYREGNVIDLGFTKLQVVDACSGLRYFIPLLVLSVLLASYYRAPLWKRGLFVLSSIPVSVVTNGLRIASVGILYQFFGPVVAEGFFHDFSGWFIFMFSLGLLLLELRLLKRFLPEAPLKPLRLEPEAAAPRAACRGSRVPLQLALPVLLLSATLAASTCIDFREKVVPARSFGEFPLVLSGWQGVRGEMEQLYLDSLDLDDYSMVDYRDPKGRTVSFYAAYYASQSKGASIHSPATCLPGSGWIFQESGAVAVPLAERGASLQVNRAFMQKGGVQELTYYWFPQRGRLLTSAWQLKFYTFWDALTRRRTDGALVRVITPVYQGERLADAETRLQGFARELTPVLTRFVPQ
ncbi:MAG: VPLPA-CTERM-specific exosortase XrtD [Geobacteraceae bacterium GWC2_58_44]|nr:MAG: VPLPA-CTERM-specific exosortase XrtD [Geobacteraceae bacterium GWC2_58_44]HBG04832.1 VPLPA-CTERM-specific exosortase XrtD [Geobacter sp.]